MTANQDSGSMSHDDDDIMHECKLPKFQCSSFHHVPPRGLLAGCTDRQTDRQTARLSSRFAMIQWSSQAARQQEQRNDDDDEDPISFCFQTRQTVLVWRGCVDEVFFCKLCEKYS